MARPRGTKGRNRGRQRPDITEGSKGTDLICTYNMKGKIEKQSKGQQEKKSRGGKREQKESRRRSS